MKYSYLNLRNVSLCSFQFKLCNRIFELQYLISSTLQLCKTIYYAYLPRTWSITQHIHCTSGIQYQCQYFDAVCPWKFKYLQTLLWWKFSITGCKQDMPVKKFVLNFIFWKKWHFILATAITDCKIL